MFLKDNVVTGKSGLFGYCACQVEKPGKCGIKSIAGLVSSFSDWITNHSPGLPSGKKREVCVSLSP